ncbi:MAG TPA: amidohydrolase family protein [Gillisia sp.]|nr:amidohydrolase family protein [Gillisia sp.]
MKFPRRDFLKKSGMLAAAGFLPGSLSSFTTPNHQDVLKQNRTFVITNAFIITMDPAIKDVTGDILVENGEIKAVGENVSLPEGISEIDGTHCIVMPGLIDCHWHMWTSLLRSMSGETEQTGYFPMTARYSEFYTPQDMAIATRYAAAEALFSGITTVTDYNHNARGLDYVMAGCDALAEIGLRARVEYSGYRNRPPEKPTDFEGIREVLQQLNNNEKYELVRLGLGSRGAAYEQLDSDWRKARDFGMGISIHASSNRNQIGQIMQLENRGLLDKDINIIHGNAITGEELDVVAKSGASITMTPYSEMRIGYGLPPQNKLVHAGINTSLGIDTTALSGNADFFSIMKVIQNLANAVAEDEFYLSSHQVLEMATINGARTLGIDHLTGSLSPGKRADLIMLKRNDLNFSSGNREKNLVVEASQPQNVALVAVDGRILKENGKLSGLDVKSIVNDAEKAFQRIHRDVNSQ